MAKTPFHEMVNRVGGFKDHRIDLMDIDGSQMGDEEAMNPPTVDQVKHTTSQEFFIS